MEDRKLPLLADRIPVNRRLFYASFLPQLPLVRADFGEAIVKEGFTNVRLVDVESALASL
ncbi:MAG: hypothetical protein H0T42_27330 [Deltaproteobacteria bacterium]|nr:hypothetical protein [Deltaproteobacteria bacterium]